MSKQLGKKRCIRCGKVLLENFFIPDTDVCVLCGGDEVVIIPVESKDYEVVEDTGCTGGACTL